MTPGSSWVAVDTGDVVIDRIRLSDDLLAAGHRTGGAGGADSPVVLVSVDEAGGADVIDTGVVGPVRSMARADLGALLVVGERRSSLLFWCHHAGLGGGSRRDHLTAVHVPSIPSDAVRTWSTNGEEEFFVSERDGGRLTASDAGIGYEVPEGDGLVRGVGGGALVVGSGQGHALVAGTLGRPGAAPEPSVWRIDVLDPPHDEGWREIRLEPRPDAVTDMDEFYVVWLAGHLDLAPLVFDDLARRVEAPDVALDPDHPLVLLVDTGSTRSRYGDSRVPGAPPLVSVGLSIAVQSRDHGPQLWTRDDAGWQVVDLPGSHLQAVASRWDRPSPWLLVDGRLWRPVGA